MKITNPVREYAEKGMAERGEKFEADGGELYKEDFAAKGDGGKTEAAE